MLVELGKEEEFDRDRVKYSGNREVAMLLAIQKSPMSLL